VGQKVNTPGKWSDMTNPCMILALGVSSRAITGGAQSKGGDPDETILKKKLRARRVQKDGSEEANDLRRTKVKEGRRHTGEAKSEKEKRIKIPLGGVSMD